MLIQNEIKTRQIELSILESEKEYHPSSRLGFRIKTEEFEGNFDRNVWVVDAEIEDLIEGLKELDQTRNGQVSLKSMSPGEFQLTFRNLDNLGHLAVEFMMSKEPFRNGYGDNLRIEFELDPTSLPEIIADFTEMKNAS